MYHFLTWYYFYSGRCTSNKTQGEKVSEYENFIRIRLRRLPQLPPRSRHHNQILPLFTPSCHKFGTIHDHAPNILDLTLQKIF